MQYLDKESRNTAATLNYINNGIWEIKINPINHYRILYDGNLIIGIDLAGGPFLEVGKEMVGYNRVIGEITRVKPNVFELWCNDELTIE